MGPSGNLSTTDNADLLFEQWFKKRNWKPFPFQTEAFHQIKSGHSGLLNAPTGSGKTYALFIPLLAKLVTENQTPAGLKIIWITPLKALANDIAMAMQTACDTLSTGWKVAVRTGDLSGYDKKKQLLHLPEVLVTTPESLHVMFSAAQHAQWFLNTQAVVVDEWHELLGNKRGTQTELVLSHIDTLLDSSSRPPLLRWGISATIGNLEEGLLALMGIGTGVIVRSQQEKKLRMVTIYPPENEKFPWGGHLGIKRVAEVASLLSKHKMLLIFTNTRAQCELWYKALIEHDTDLSGQIAMHHGSLDTEIRAWVEDKLKSGKLKAVVCTSSLDLGVDFRPVDAIVQIGGPKGVARFIQRAGRSGHRPGEESIIYFVPTHSLELIEASALRKALEEGFVEQRIPVQMAVDVLIQYLVTLATGDGFDEQKLFLEVRKTYAYSKISPEVWRWVLNFITTGGEALEEYQEYARVQMVNGVFKVVDKKIALRHRLSIGTIVADPSVKVKYMSGPYIGSIEESFIARLSEGDQFWFAGKCLSFVKLKDMTAWVKKATKPKGIVPQWMGGRMPFSSQLASLIREEIEKAKWNEQGSEERNYLEPVFEIQNEWSEIPSSHQLLIEQIETKEGFHVFFYPFEGYVVHELLAALIAFRLGLIQPMSFSMAINDFGFELLSDQEIDLNQAFQQGLLNTEHLEEDLIACVNDSEMAKRRFREIAHISGLVFQGFPGQQKSYKHLQASTSLLFDVLKTYDQDNLLLTQAFGEVLAFQLEKDRLIKVIDRLHQLQPLMVKTDRFTPFCFPIMVEFLRSRLSSEKLEDRIEKMKLQNSLL